MVDLMSPYRHLIVCAILFFVLFYGFANLVKAEPISADCDYEHVAMLFGAKACWTIIPRAHYPSNDIELAIFQCYSALVSVKNSTSGLPFDYHCNLVRNGPLGIEVIDMRDIAQAIQHYQKSQST